MEGRGSVRTIPQSADDIGLIDLQRHLRDLDLGAKQMKRYAVQSSLSLLAIAGALVLGSFANAQNNNQGQNNQGGGGGGVQAAGVIVSPEGVLRIKMFGDASVLVKKWQADAKARLPGDLAKASPLRKISLNRLEAAVAEKLAAGKPATEEMNCLAGLTRLQYVFFYPETNDIVIAGPAEAFSWDASGRALGVDSGRAVLELQDLIVALRAYGPGGNATHEIAVSIDPTQEGLRKMQQFLANIRGNVKPGDSGMIVDGLKENLGLQNVTVLGISPETHFAQVLVEADYRMKLIGIGIEKPPVKLASYVDKASAAQVSANAMQRWFFVPNYECVRVSDDELAMELVGDGVKLVGENELVNADGTRANNAKGSKASELFCQGFTEKYPQIASKVAVYAQMRNLIDLSIAAAYIQQQDMYGKSGWKMEFFGNESACPVQTCETPKTVETACTAVWKGSTLMTPVGGGVKIETLKALEKNALLKDEKGTVQAAHEKVSLKNLAKSQWWWD